MKKPTRILIVEDNTADVDLAKHAIRKVLKACEFQVVQTRKDFLEALETFQPAVILSDYSLPHFDGMKALKLALKHSPLTPLIIWTGSISEDIAVDCMKAGANNYVLKENIKRLGPAVIHALEERQLLLERKQAEEVLQNSEKHFRSLIENGLDNISLLAADGTLLWESPATVRTLNYAPNEFVGRSIFELMHPDDLEWTHNLYTKLIQEPGSHQRGVFRLRHSDDTWRWVEAIVTNMLNEPGVNAIVINYRDVTERKQTEEALRESQAKYQNLVETSHDLIWSVDMEGKITFLNRAAKEIYGFEPEELLGHSFAEILDSQHYHQDELIRFRETLEHADEFKDVEIYVRHRDGRQIILSSNSIVLRDESGNMTGVTGSSHDITMHKQVEDVLKEERNLLRTLIDNLPDHIFVINAQGRKTLANTADWKASGGKTMEDVIGKSVFDTYPPELAEQYWQLDKAIIDSGQPLINYEEPGLDADGNQVSILTTKVPLRDSEGKIIGLVGIGRDITERKQAEEKLRLSDQILQRVNALVLVADSQGSIIYVSPAAKTILGYEPDELLGDNWWKLSRFESSEARNEKGYVGQAARGEVPIANEAYERSIRDRWGNTRWISWVDAAGPDGLLIGVGHDVTEREQAKARINDLLAFNEKILNHSSVGILTYKLTGECVFANENAASIVGATIEQLKAQNFYTIESWRESGLYDLVEKALTTQKAITSDIHMQSTFGKDIWMTVHCVTFRSKDEDHVLLSMSNITERKRAEEALRESENRLILALSAAQMSVWEWDLRTNHILWSPEFFEITGVTEDGFDRTFESFTNLIHPEDGARVRASAEKALAEKTLFAEEFRIVCPDGEVRWLSNLGHAEYDSSRKHLRLIGTIQDITNRKQAEEALRQSENRYRTLVETQTEFIVRWKSDGMRTFANEAYCCYFGLTPEEAISSTFIPLVHEQDRQSIEEKIHRLLSGAASVETDIHRVIKPDGSIGWQEWTDQAIRDNDGQLVEFQSVGRDITARKQAEIERQALLEVMQGLASTNDLQELLKLIHHSIDQVIYAKNFFVVLYQENSGLFEEIYSVDQYDPPAAAAKLEKSITSYVFHSSEPLLLTQALFDELVARGEVELVGTNSASWLGVPLKTSGKTIGVIAVQDYENNNRYSERDKEFLASIATQVALAIERKQSEQALQENERRFRALIEKSKDVIASVDAEGKITYVSPSILSVLGYEVEEYIGRNGFEFLHPEDRENTAVLLTDLAQHPGKSITTLVRERHKDGLWHWLEGSATNLLNDPNINAIIINFRDVTERKQAEAELRASEERFRQLADNIQEVFWMTDAEGGKEIYMSPAAEVIWGRSIENLTNEPNAFINSVFPEDQPTVLHAIDKEKNGEKVEMEYRIMQPDGSLRWVWDRAFPISDSLGRVKRIAGISADITERREAELALIKSQSRYRELFDSSPISIWEEDFSLVKKRINTLLESGITDLKQYFSSYPDEIVELAALVKTTDVNQASLDLYGVEQKEQLLKDLTQTLSMDALSHFQEEILGFISPLRSFVWEGTERTFDGRQIEVLVTGSIPHGYEEDWTKVIVTISDITERKRAEQALLRREQQLEEAQRLGHIGSWEWDMQTNAATWSNEMYRLFNRDPQLPPLDVESYITHMHPDDKKRVMQIIQPALQTGQPFSFDYRFTMADGKIHWLHLRGETILDNNGQPLQVQGITQDITERREGEQQLRKLSRAVEQSASTIIITDTAGNMEYVNPKFTEITGYGFEEVIGQNPRVLKSGFTSNDENERMWQTITSGNEWHGELLNKKKNGELFWEYATISPILNESGETTHFLAVKEDITERKRADEEIRQRSEETSALLKTSLALTNLDLQVTLQTIGNSAKTLFAADGCRIFLMEPDGEFLRCVLALQENFAAFSNLRIKIGQGVTGTVAASGQAEIVNEMQNDTRAVQVAGTQEQEKEAIMFAPLKERDRTIGVLSIRRAGTERLFQSIDLELLEAFASMAASAVSNARLFEETQRRLAELEALYENGLAVGRLLKPREIGERIINTFAQYLPWHHVTIRLRREESDDLELVAFNLPNLKEEERTGAEQHFIARINKVSQGLSGWVIQTGLPLRTGNVHAHPQYIGTHAGIQSGLYMPLKVGERAIGVISVESETPDAFTEQDERLLATLASQASIAFENARLYEAIQKELSERKRAEEALRTSETHYRELADSITDILFELDQNLHYTHWNRASEILMGISATDAIGKSFQEIFGETEEQTRIRKIYEDVLKSHKPRILETTILVNGQKRSFEINAYPSTRGVSVVAKDVTERKRSETIMQKRFELMEYSAHHSLNELMQRTVDEVSEVTGSTIGFFHFVETDQINLGMQTWSTNALRLFNVPMSEGTHFALDQAGLWAEAVRQRRPLIQNDYESLAIKKGLPQGHVPILREIVIPIIRNEKIMAVMGIGDKQQEYTQYDLEIAERLADYAWDITERKQMEYELAEERNQLAQRVEERTSDLSRANSNLARALRVKDEFLANMSHELRTPLNAILGLSESLAEQIAGPLNEKQQKYINTISESGHHLLSLINDILDLAKIDAGQITLDINKVDIHSVCQASLRMIKQLAQKKNQEVIFEIDNGLGLMWADERRLKQMIVNLLGNAVKFTPENGRLGLEVHGDQDANRVTFTAWDNGIGIKADDLLRLFQPFIQLDSGLAREATGTGLGLALVAQMARLHGGSASATSEPEKGSRFSIILPWEPALAMDTASRLRSTGKFRAIKPDEMNKPTILLVEDTQEVVMMIKDYLELAGYKIATAQDGVDAIVQAKLVRPDLILMDIQMPRMDGFEATRKLRSEPDFRYTPIIALTALAMPNDRERCLAAGMDEYISKPVNLKALVKIIQSCLFNEKESKS